jgi:hypothetical protein
MYPTSDIPPGLLDNAAAFGDAFFSGLVLRGAPTPLVVNGREKPYLFPTLYADVRCAVAIFHCSRAAAKAYASERLGTEVEPPIMLGGRAIVAVSCYEYRSVSGVRPYNEIAVAIPLRLGSRAGLPVLGAFAQAADSGYLIAAMPVTSEENRLRGEHFWNLPKRARRIDIEEDEESCAFLSYAADGSTLDMSLRVPKSGKPKRFDVRSAIFTRKDGKLLRSPTAFAGDFSVRLNAATLLSPRRSASPCLVLGSGEASEALRAIGAEEVPLQTRYARAMNSLFDLPSGT